MPLRHRRRPRAQSCAFTATARVHFPPQPSLAAARQKSVWPVPDQSNYYTLTYYRVIQVQDANYENGQTVDIPYRWFDAFAAGLASRLAAIYAPDRVPLLEPKAEAAYMIAATQDTENVPMYLTPGLSGYYRI